MLANEQDFRGQLVALLPRLRRFCAGLTRNGDAGDDLCQATIERALSQAHRFEPGTRLDSWMYRIARNLQIDTVRRHRTRGVELDIDDAFDLAGDDGVAIVERRSDLSAIETALAGLPEEQRALVTLVIIDGQSYRDAAAILDIPIGTVMSRLARARRAIDTSVRGAA